MKALSYYLRISNIFDKHCFILGGHSKGGNLAVYAAVPAPLVEQVRITAVYNNDGPGFHQSIREVSNSEEWKGKFPVLNIKWRKHKD